MSLRKNRNVLIGVCLFLTSLLEAQTREPVFDPHPIQIPAVRNQPKRPVTALDLLQLREVKVLTISPDGRFVAFVLHESVYETNSYRTGLFVAETKPQGAVISLGSAGPPRWDESGEGDSEPPKWSPDSESLAFRLQRAGTWQIWKWIRSKNQMLQLTDSKADVQRFEWSPDGSKVVFTTETVEPVDLQELSQRGILYEDSLYEHSVYPWEKKSIIAAAASRAKKKVEHWITDITSKEQRSAKPEEIRWLDSVADPNALLRPLNKSAEDLEESVGGYIDAIKLSPNGLQAAIGFFITSASASETARSALYLLDRDQLQPVELAAEARYIVDLWWSKDGRRLYYESSSGKGQTRQLSVIKFPSLKSYRLNQTPGIFSNFSVSDDGAMIVCLSQSSTKPPEVALIEASSGGKVRTIANVNPEFENIQLSPSTRMEWKDKYGEVSFGHLVRPTNYVPGKLYPLIVTTYRSGDGFLRGGVGNEYPIQLFAANGFVVLSFDAGTIHNSKPGDFDSAMLRWQKPLESMEAALASIGEMRLVDPKRRGITGLSFGAEIVQFILTEANLFQAAISSGIGGRDQFAFYVTGRSKYWRQTFKKWGLEEWPEDPASTNWKRFSTAMRADRVQAPWLVHVSDSELIPGYQMITTLERLGKVIEVIVYPDEFHIKNQPRHLYEIWQRNVDWFKFWLMGTKDPDPLKKEQYDRWEKYTIHDDDADS